MTPAEAVKLAADEAVKLKEVISALWVIIASLAAGGSILFWRLFTGLEKRVEKKVDREVCEKEHEVIDSMLHKHAESGRAGEVVER